MMASKTAVLATLLLGVAPLAASSAALAGDRGSMEDQMACTPDVYRLCSSLIPDEDAITACLKQHINALSAGCHKVFSRPPSQGDNNSDDD